MNHSLSPVFKKTLGLATTATLSAIVTRIFVTFDHGIWLIAYLLLVGTVAQYLLVRGQMWLVPDVHRRVAGLEASLWTTGVVVVPLGVLLGVRLLVVVGSIVLLGALLVFWLYVRDAVMSRLANGVAVEVVAYLGLLVFMTISVFVGIGLSSDLSWV